jgi:hypothetical protein
MPVAPVGTEGRAEPLLASSNPGLPRVPLGVPCWPRRGCQTPGQVVPGANASSRATNEGRLVVRPLRALAITVVVGGVGLASVGLALADDGKSAGSNAANSRASRFVGYWMGIDPVDGGDSRRGFTRNPDGTISMAGRDSYLSLCDGTDHGLASFSDGVVTGRVMTTNNLVLQCFNNDQTVTLRARFELLDANLIRETLTRPDGSQLPQIHFHRVSED